MCCDQIEARELARRLLEGDESANLERKVMEAQRLLELLKHGRVGFGIKRQAMVSALNKELPWSISLLLYEDSCLLAC